MKNAVRFLCLALCLCLLPVLGLAEAPEGMTAYEVSGIPYYIRNDWTDPLVNGNYTYYYKTAGNPYDGLVMIMELDENDTAIPKTDSEIDLALSSTVTGLEQSLGTAVTSESLELYGRKGIYFFGPFVQDGKDMGLCGYVTITDTEVVAIVLVCSEDDEAVARPQLYEVLGLGTK